MAEYTAAISIAAEMKATDSAVQATVPMAYYERGYLYALDSAYALAKSDIQQALQLAPGRKCEFYEALAEIAIAEDNPEDLVAVYTVLSACRPPELV